MFGMWKTFCHELQLVSTQANPPQALPGDSQGVPHLQEALREHAGPGHARAHPQPRPHLQHLRQGLLKTLAAPRTPEKSHGGEALRMRSLWKEVC